MSASQVTPSVPQYLSISAATEAFGIGRTLLFRLIRLGAPTIKVGKRRLIPRIQFERYLQQNFAWGQWSQENRMRRGRRARRR